MKNSSIKNGAIILAGDKQIELSDLPVTESRFTEKRELNLYLLNGKEVMPETSGWLEEDVITVELLTELYGAPVDDSDCHCKIWFHWSLMSEDGYEFDIWLPNTDRYNNKFKFRYEEHEALEYFLQDLELTRNDYTLA